jgi:hypothetical protein
MNERYKIHQYILGFGLVLLVVFTACEKDLFNPDKINKDGWNPIIAIPLTSSRLTIKDLIPSNSTTDNFINIDSTSGAISLTYKGDIFNVTASEMVNIPNQVQETSVSFDLDSFPGTGATFNIITTQKDSIVYQFDAGDSIKVHSIGFRAGTMSFKVTTSLAFNAQITATITSLTKNGVPAKLIFDINGDGSEKTYSSQVNLANYVIDMTLGANGYNEIIIEYDYEMTLPIPATGRPAETISFDLEQGFSDIIFGNIIGNLGNQVFALDKDSLVLSIFENTLADADFGAFEISEPAINILVTSSIGVPLALNIIELNAFEPETNTNTAIQLQSSSFNIQAPLNIGDTKISKIPITGSNSNIKDVLTPTNKVITYELAAEINPNGQNNINFITPEARISVQAEMELPLEVGISGWALQDTVDFSLDQFNEITEAMLRVNIDNGFPFEIDLQIYLLDSTNTLIDSLINSETSLLQAALVDVNGDVTASSISNSDIGLGSQTIANLGKTKKLVIRGGLSTSNNGQKVQIYDFYELGIKMGIKVGINGDNLLESK